MPERTRQLYVLSRYPEASQTFVRNEIFELRRLGVSVGVLSMETTDTEHIAEGWAGPFRIVGRPGVLRAIVDHGWHLVRNRTRYLRFLRRVVMLRQGWRYSVRRLPSEARAILRAAPPQGCHTHFAWESASNVACLAALLGVRASITVHAKDLYVSPPERLRRQLACFDRIVTISNFNVGVLGGLGIVPIGGNGVQVVPCGVEVPDTTEPEPEFAADVVSVGRLVEKKGFPTFVRAMAIVRETYPDVRATIVGDGPERESVMALIEELGLDPNVKLLGGRQHQETLRRIASAKLFCLAAQRASDGDMDGIPVVIREAMARGVPVVTTKVAGIPETVDDEVGWTVPPERADALAAAIVEGLDADHERARRGLAARERVCRHWTLGAQARHMAQVLEVPSPDEPAGTWERV